MPFISVCVPTNRVGGIDLLLEGLLQQSFTDFEVVLADGLHKYRKDLVADRIKSYPFPIKHVEPKNNLFPLNQFSHVANTALANASGEIVVFFVDYTYAPPDLLAAHAAFHQQNDRMRGLMCPHNYFEVPELHTAFPKYGNEELDQYIADLNSGKLDPCMWSIFARDVKAGDKFEELDRSGYANVDPKLTADPGGVHPTYFHGKNESCSLSAVLDINGWDEALDGSHCYQDSDIAERLNVHNGVQWTVQPIPIAQIVNPRRIFPFPLRVRPVEDNLRIWKTAKASGYPHVNQWSLRTGA